MTRVLLRLTSSIYGVIPAAIARKIVSFFIFLLFTLLTAKANNITSNENNQEFIDFINGVKKAAIELDYADQKEVDNGSSKYLEAFSDYLKNDMGFETVAFTSAAKEEMFSQVASFCEVARVKPKIEYYNNLFFTNFKIDFISCLDQTFSYKSQDTIYLSESSNLYESLIQTWAKTCNIKNKKYNTANQFKLPIDATGWTREKLYASFENLPPDDELAGIYTQNPEAQSTQEYQVALVPLKTNKYQIVYLDGASNYLDWHEGELIGEIIASSVDKIYNVRWRKPNKLSDETVTISLDPNGITLLTNEKRQLGFTKAFPKKSSLNDRPISTGTGIAISTDGYILTNTHVIEGGSRFEFQITDAQSGITSIYNGVLEKTDPQNDLAILKIVDMSFKPLLPVPYKFNTQMADMAEKVYTLGYPLTQTMGTSVKFQDGTISALNGYNGDATTYQVGMSVEPGNGGAPLFNEKGELIGIIKARHSKAPNATYVIKIRYAVSLIQRLKHPPTLTEDSALSLLSITDQIKILRPYVFLIKVYDK